MLPEGNGWTRDDEPGIFPVTGKFAVSFILNSRSKCIRVSILMIAPFTSVAEQGVKVIRWRRLEELLPDLCGWVIGAGP